MTSPCYDCFIYIWESCLAVTSQAPVPCLSQGNEQWEVFVFSGFSNEGEYTIQTKTYVNVSVPSDDNSTPKWNIFRILLAPRFKGAPSVLAN